jgi:hypothetical protein
MSDFDFNELQRLLSYDPNTGNFTWLTRVSNVPAGSVAGTKNSKGYIQIRANGQRYLAHKLAWFYTHGVWPTKLIDHINGIPDDNRIANLREVSANENMHNQRRAHSRTQSGYLGVSLVKSRGKWQAGLGVSGRFKFLGYFDTPEEAHTAYLNAKKIYHPSAPVN